MPDIDLSRLWETLKSSGAQTSLLVALIGQATTGLIFQVSNNEQQAAGILSTQAAIRDFKDQVSNLQTPLGQRFIKLEDRVDEAIRIGQARVAQTDRIEEQIRIIHERLIVVDHRLLELELRLREKHK